MRLKLFLLYIFLHQFTLLYCQESNHNPLNNNLFEDKNGALITAPAELEAYLIKRKNEVETYTKNNARTVLNQNPVPLCSNSGFEEFTFENGENILKNFQYTVENPLKPIQCKSSTQNSNLGIKQYNPSNYGLMATTVPSNYIDEFIGNVDGFDQYCLKLNHKQSSTTMTLVQAKRFKTDNENVLKLTDEQINTYLSILNVASWNNLQDRVF